MRRAAVDVSFGATVTASVVRSCPLCYRKAMDNRWPVSNGPQAEISSILTVRALGRCKPVA
jgi:hypothetical protein